MTDIQDERVIAEWMGYQVEDECEVCTKTLVGRPLLLVDGRGALRTVMGIPWSPSTDANLWFGDEGLNTAIRSAPAWQGMTDHGGGPVVKTLETGYIVALRSLILKRQGMCGEFDIISASLEDRTHALAEAIREMKEG